MAYLDGLYLAAIIALVLLLILWWNTLQAERRRVETNHWLAGVIRDALETEQERQYLEQLRAELDTEEQVAA